VSVERNEAAGAYRLRRGIASIAPGVLAPLSCSPGLVEPGPSVALAPGIAQFGMVQDSLAQLRTLSAGNCQVNAWLRFGRAPELNTGAGTLSDYRFAMTPRGNFTTLQVAAAAAQPCPASLPPWGYPRADLLHESGK
jgi:inner membrane protein